MGTSAPRTGLRLPHVGSGGSDFGRRSYGVLAARRCYSGPSPSRGTPRLLGSLRAPGQQACRRYDRPIPAGSERGAFRGSFPGYRSGGVGRVDKSQCGSGRYSSKRRRSDDWLLGGEAPREWDGLPSTRRGSADNTTRRLVQATSDSSSARQSHGRDAEASPQGSTGRSHRKVRC
jgi:hypothetical protein